MNDLVYGDSGSSVTLLQQLLRINEYFPASITGVYGPDTTTYVEMFQKDNDLPVTGEVDSNMWNLLYDLTNPAVNFSVLNKPTLKLGDSGEEVEEVQTILRSLGYYKGVINGVFDELVDVSLKAFQFVNKLVPSGIVETTTWSALIFLYAPLANCEEGVVEEVVYVVKSGDTLYSIARDFGVTVDDIKRVNNLSNDVLNIGQEIIISKDPSASLDEKYVVKTGDTLYSIAREIGISVDVLKEINNLTSDLLSVGQVLLVPVDIVVVPPVEGNTYTVKSGDTLYSIALKYGVSVSDIITANNLTSNVLNVGQLLEIPKEIEQPSPSESITYVVKSGDTLYNIARQYGVSVNDILTFNSLNSALLTIGQILEIPIIETEEITYTVQKGDTLYSIANKFNTTVDSIITNNNLSNTVLSIGQVLKI